MASANDFDHATPALRNVYKAIEAGRAQALESADAQIRTAERFGIKCLAFDQDGYPHRLAQCADAPTVLFVKGAVNFETAKILSVVGTRKPTDDGRMITDRIVGDLCQRHPDIVIVSGLAFGIDIVAHRAAMRHSRPTVGVVAHGLDTLYPAQHRKEAVQMVENDGALVTEFSFGTQPEAYNFVSRNRIIAGLADATLVVESGAKGGSLITVRNAFDYDRAVLAVPGFPGREQSQGCNDAIKRNIAALVENADDVDAQLGWDVPAAVKKAGGIQASLFPEPQNDDERAIVAALRAEDGLTASVIGQRSRLPISVVNVALLNMEFSGIVKSLPGNSYRLMI